MLTPLTGSSPLLVGLSLLLRSRNGLSLCTRYSLVSVLFACLIQARVDESSFSSSRHRRPALQYAIATWKCAYALPTLQKPSSYPLVDVA